MDWIDLLRDYPLLPWDEPVLTYSVGSDEAPGLGCRICIALYGLRGAGMPDQFPDQPELLTHVSKLPKNREDFMKHLCEVHHHAVTS